MERERKRDKEVEKSLALSNDWRKDHGHRRDKGVKRRMGVYYNAGDGNKNCQVSEKSQDMNPLLSSSSLREGMVKVKEERLKQNPEGVCESRKIEESLSSEKEKAMLRCKVFEEQDSSVLEESEYVETVVNTKSLAGAKVCRGIDKEIEGGDQDILADGCINADVDMLETVEIGHRKSRDEVAKENYRIFVDPYGENKMLTHNESVGLDVSGCFGDEAISKPNVITDPTSCATISSDYVTSEEILQFRKPKKVKSLRNKEKLDLDVLEFEVSSGGISVGVHGSRKYGQTADKNEQERCEAYRAALVKAEGAAKVLRQELSTVTQVEHDGNLVFGDEDGDFNKSLELSSRLAFEKQDNRAVSGPMAVASLALSISPLAECIEYAETCKRKVVFTEMEEFAHGIQLRQEMHRPRGEATRDEEKVFQPANEETKDESGGFSEVSDFSEGAHSVDKEAIPWNADSEVVVGKGLSGTLELLRKHRDLKDTRKLEMNQKDLYRELCHKFHGKEPGKLKKEKRMKLQEQEQAKNSYSPSLSVDRMRAAQTQMKTPFLLLSGRLNPGQISDPRSGLATMINNSTQGVGSS